MGGASALIAVLGLLSLGLAGCGGAQDAHGPVAGPVAGRVTTVLHGAAQTFVVPTGDLAVTVGKPVEGVSAQLADDAERHHGRFVPVAWHFDPLADVPGKAVLGTAPRATGVRIAVGGSSYALPAPYHLSGGAIGGALSGVAYVPAPSPGAAKVAVTYDGLTQTWDQRSGTLHSGVAASLYDGSASARKVACPDGSATTAGARRRVTCTVTVQRIPYDPGRGWAPAGHAFAVVGYDIRLDGAPVDAATATTTRATAKVTVDGAAPIGSVGQSAASPGRAQGIDVYDASIGGGTFTVAVSFTVASVAGSGGSTVTVRRTVPLP